MSRIEILSYGVNTPVDITESFHFIGRHPSCDIQIKGDRGVSRYHATLFKCDAGYAIFPGSIELLIPNQPTNGLRVNGQAIESDTARILRNGDIVALTQFTHFTYYREQEQEREEDGTYSQAAALEAA